MLTAKRELRKIDMFLRVSAIVHTILYQSHPFYFVSVSFVYTPISFQLSTALKTMNFQNNTFSKPLLMKLSFESLHCNQRCRSRWCGREARKLKKSMRFHNDDRSLDYSRPHFFTSPKNIKYVFFVSNIIFLFLQVALGTLERPNYSEVFIR